MSRRKQYFLLSLLLSSIGLGFPVGKTNDQATILLASGVGMVFYQPYGAGFSIDSSIGARVATDLYVGADLGVGFLGDVTALTVSGDSYGLNSIDNTGATAVQILPTVFYRPRLPGSNLVRWFLGFSMGPNIFIQSLPTSALTSSSSTKVYFEALVRPGVELSVSHQVGFLFESKFGVMRTSFIFLPQLCVTIGF